MRAQHELQDANRKRGREDEYQDVAAGGTLGFTEHRSKRMQALPLRIPDASKRWPAPSNLPLGQESLFGQATPHIDTPSTSESDDVTSGPQNDGAAFQHQRQQYVCQPSPPTFHMEPELGPVEEMDVVMASAEQPPALMEGQHGQGHQVQGEHLRPGSLQPDPIGSPTITGRMPTPIQPSFAAQIRGVSKNWSGAAGNVMSTPPPQHLQHNAFANARSLREPPQGLASGRSDPRSLEGGVTDWGQVQNRRLPSPISEAGGEADCAESSSASMAMDSTPGFPDYHGGQHLSPPRASSAMEMGGSSPAVTVAPRVATPHVIVTEGDGSMDVEAATPSPPRKGHSRSRHTLNNWTQQPGMKKSFSIGYRSDCEKCRLKVPGHFNHIIIS